MLKPARTFRVSGFTMVELAVVLATFFILALLGIPSFQKWIKEKQIRTTAESIKSGLLQARQLAIKSNTSITFNLNPDAGIRWNITDPLNTSINSGPIEGGMTAILVTPTPSSATTITFTGAGQTKPGSANTNCPAAGTPGSLLDNSSNCTGSSTGSTLGGGAAARFAVTNSVDISVPALNVIISSGGEIRTCDPNESLTTGDPRKC
jgi:Tfp pilus assembly protein FimT